MRKFAADGKNDIRINGRSATVKMLRSIMSHFVDICGQNEYQILGNKVSIALYLTLISGKDRRHYSANYRISIRN